MKTGIIKFSKAILVLVAPLQMHKSSMIQMENLQLATLRPMNFMVLLHMEVAYI